MYSNTETETLDMNCHFNGGGLYRGAKLSLILHQSAQGLHLQLLETLELREQAGSQPLWNWYTPVAPKTQWWLVEKREKGNTKREN